MSDVRHDPPSSTRTVSVQFLGLHRRDVCRVRLSDIVERHSAYTTHTTLNCC